MSDALNPTGPSQPKMETAYNTEGNPISHTAQENSEARRNAQNDNSMPTDKRNQGDLQIPSSHQEEATPSSLGQGVRDASQDKGEAMGSAASDLDGEQMRAPGEGEVSRKQQHKDGFGEQEDLASDLDRKKAEQADAREQIKFQRQHGNADAALSDRGGPAAPC